MKLYEISRSERNAQSSPNPAYATAGKTTAQLSEFGHAICTKASLSTHFSDSCHWRICVRLLQIIVVSFVIGLAMTNHAQNTNAFGTTSITRSINEDINNAGLSGLNTRIQNALRSGPAYGDYTFTLDARGKTKFEFINVKNNLHLRFKDGQKLDYETMSTFTFVITSKRDDGKSTNQLQITLNIRDVNERPELRSSFLGTTGLTYKAYYVQFGPGQQTASQIRITSSQVFQDPEGKSIQFKACADDIQVTEHDDAGQVLTSSTSNPNPRGSFDEHASTDASATGQALHCPPTDSGNYAASRDVTRNGRIVNVTTQGPTIVITPLRDSVSSNRYAELQFRGWAGTPDTTASRVPQNKDISKPATVRVYVKTGVNNPPAFGSIGFRTRVNESTANDIEFLIGPKTPHSAGAWNARDIDGDKVTYTLEGPTASTACATDSAGKRRPQVVAAGQGCVWIVMDGDNLQLWGKNLDYESAPLPNREYTVTVVANDGYTNPGTAGRVPIHLQIVDVDEGLEFSGPIREISQLVVGRAGRTANLSNYFTDPDGTAISYSVFTSNPNIVTATVSGSMLTVNPAGGTGSASITITATSGTTSNSQTFTVTVRSANQPPTFAQGIRTVNADQTIRETQSTGLIIRARGMRYSDPDGDKVTATVTNSALFEAVVDPKIDGRTYSGEVGLKLIGALDFETISQHTVTIRLNDGWDDSQATADIIVIVTNVNEPPQVATDAQGRSLTIPDKTVSVGSTASFDASIYFKDPDGGRLLYDATPITGATFVEVTIVGVSTVQFKGLKATTGTPITIRVTVTDTSSVSVSLNFKLTIDSNTPPRVVRKPENQTLRLGPARTISLVGSFSDDDPGDTISRYEASSNNDSIVLARATNDGQSMVLIPRAEGTTSVVITAIDSRGGRNTTSITVTVLGNSAPVIDREITSVNLRPNGQETIDLTQHFSDPDGDTISFTASVNLPNIATATLNNNRYLTVQAHDRGTATVSVKATDPDAESASTTFLVSVVNDAPSAEGRISVVIEYRGNSDSVDLTPIFSDPDGDTLTFKAVTTDGSVATAAINNATLTVTAVGVGQSEITVTATDEYGLTGSTTFSVTVVNQAPNVTSQIANQSTYRKESLIFNLARTFSDPDDDELTYSATITDGSIARVVVEGSSLTVIGVALGTADVTVAAQDGLGGEASDTFSVTIQNRDPQTVGQISDQTTIRQMSTDLDLEPIFSDPDADELTYEVNVSNPRIVSAEITGSMLTFTGTAIGTTSLTVNASDSTGAQATTRFRVTVENQPPIVVMEIEDVSTHRGGTERIDLTTIFSDPDDDPLQYLSTVSDPSVAIATIAGNTLTVTGREVKMTTVEVTARDAFQGSISTRFNVTVANRPPMVIEPLANMTLNRTEEPTISLSTVFSDEDGDSLEFAVTSSSPNVATAVISNQNLVVQTHTVGTTELSLTATDKYDDSAMLSFSVTVENLRPRVVTDLADVVTNRTKTATIDLSNTFIDDDGDALTLTIEIADSSIATALIAGETLTIQGIAIGSTTMTVMATDTLGAMASSMFGVDVENLAPTVATELEGFELQVGGDAQTRDVATVFADDGSEPLTISASVVNESVVSVSVAGTSVTVSPLARGATQIEITATDAQQATVSTTVGVVVGDADLKAVANTGFATFSRAVLSSVTSTLGARLLADADGLYTAFTAFSLNDIAPTEHYVAPFDHALSTSQFGRANDGWVVDPLKAPEREAYHNMNQLEAFIGRGFSLKLAAVGDPTYWSIWGALDRQSFEASNHEGNTNSFYFGGDMTIQGQWLVGLGIGRTSGEVEYTSGTATQTMDNDITQFLPYARMTPSDRTTLYGTFGIGSGTVDTTVIGHANERSDLKSTLGLLGGRQVVFVAPNGLNLAVVGDIGFANFETDQGSNAANGLLAEVSRFRGGLETSFNMMMGPDGSFAPFLTLSLRTDSGDGLAESGLEISGGVRIANPVFSVDANFRTLATYGADDYSESGFSLMAVLNPSAGATGLSIAFSPSWGASAHHTNALWQDDYQTNSYSYVDDLASWGLLDNQRLKVDSAIGYGFLVLHERFLLTPYIDVQSSGSRYHDVNVGAKLMEFTRSKHNVNLNLQVGKDSSFGAREDSVRLNARLNF